jgi:hypothetical protein
VTVLTVSHTLDTVTSHFFAPDGVRYDSAARTVEIIGGQTLADGVVQVRNHATVILNTYRLGTGEVERAEYWP